MVIWKPGCRCYSREQYRLLLQGHLDERARLENGHRRELTTVLGPVTVTRKAYRASAGTGDVGTGTTSPTASDTQPGPASDGTGMTTGPTSGVLASTPTASDTQPGPASDGTGMTTGPTSGVLAST